MTWLLAALLLGCQSDEPANYGTGTPTTLSTTIDPAVAHPSCLDDAELILETPDEGDFAQYLEYGFTRYTQVVAPGGGVIPIFAQTEISKTQLLRARGILQFYLTDVPGSTWGADKSDVANAMVTNGAALMMPNDEHVEGEEPPLPAQPLYEREMPEDGSDWFMENDFKHRDAAFEEIFHLVHDTGIGTTAPGVRPEYQTDLLAEALLAVEDGRWGIPVDPNVADWIAELEQEGSLSQEYIAAVIDSYYGLWGPWEDRPGAMWGIYAAKNRAAMASVDPAGMALLEQFLPPMLTHEVRLDPALDVAFTLTFDPALPYTHKSQYMTNVTLTGGVNIALTGNSANNTLRGNSGDNVIDGADGDDTMVYCHAAAVYQVAADGDSWTVTGPDGVDTLIGVEWIHYADGVVAL